MSEEPHIRIELGPEYDEWLLDCLHGLLVQLGAKAVAQGRAVAGSQDLMGVEVEVLGGVVLVEAETYCGLSIQGHPRIVHRIRTLLRESMGEPLEEN